MSKGIKTVSFWLLISGIVALAATTGVAQEAVESSMDISGAIVSVDAAASSLVVKDEGKGEVTIVIDENTIILSGDETAALADLAKGQVVFVEYKENNGKNMASLIEAEEAE